MSGPLDNVKGQERKRDREKLRKAQQRSDFLAVASSPQGQRFLWDVLNTYCVVNSRAPLGQEGLFVQGRQEVGRLLDEQLAFLDPDLWRAFHDAGRAQHVDEIKHRRSADTEPDDGD